MRRSLFIVSLAVALPGVACAKPVSSQSPGGAHLSSAALANDLEKMAIAGVHWSQSESDAIAALKANGFSITSQDKSQTHSFAEQVSAAVAGGMQMRDGYEYTLHAEKPNERVSVKFISYPDGWRVESVGYGYNGGRTAAELKAAAEAKYKAAGLSIETIAWSTACIPAPASCTDFPNIMIVDQGEFELELRPGDKGERTASEAFEDAVRQQKGDTKPSF